MKVLKAWMLLALGNILAVICHWFAHTEQEMAFTMLGWLSTAIAWLNYGFDMGAELEAKRLKRIKDQLG